MNVNKKLLCCALLGALSMAQSVAAQDFDDRWYLTVAGGVISTDGSRGVDDAWTLGFGVGKFITRNVSVDLELDRGIADGGGAIDWDLGGLALMGRYHFRGDEGRNWWPYLAAGIGSAYHSEEYIGMVTPRSGHDMLGKVGFGVYADIGSRIDLRAEAGVRMDFDDSSVAAAGRDSFTDYYGNVTAMIAIGPEPSAPVTPDAPRQSTCADLDDDGDGVNNCNDKCPGSQAGQAIGPDGCPVPLTIDLKGVNFDFDKDELRPDAVAILDEAVSILQKYPQLRVEVAGHTDSIGTDEYNQGLSERRARAVYDYLTGHGIDAGRLVGPNGFGESRPIDTNDTREGRARNRRTELNVQN